MIESLKKGTQPDCATNKGDGEGAHELADAPHRAQRRGTRSPGTESQGARDERLVEELRRRYKPEVEALSDYLGRDLVALWGYDDVH